MSEVNMLSCLNFGSLRTVFFPSLSAELFFETFEMRSNGTFSFQKLEYLRVFLGARELCADDLQSNL